MRLSYVSDNLAVQKRDGTACSRLKGGASFENAKS